MSDPNRGDLYPYYYGDPDPYYYGDPDPYYYGDLDPERPGFPYKSFQFMRFISV